MASSRELMVPFAPRRDDFHFRRDGFVRQLEAYLVVAFARAAVRDGIGAGFQRDFRLALGNTGRAIEVPSRYLCSYTAPARSVGQM